MRRSVCVLAVLALLGIGFLGVDIQPPVNAAPAAAAAFGAWQQVHLPTTAPATVRDMAISPSGELYVSFHKEGTWRTADYGKTWQNITHNLPELPFGGMLCLTPKGDLLLTPSLGRDANIRGIHRLPAGSTKWEPVAVDYAGLSGSTFPNRIVVNKAGDVICVASGCQVLRSTDGGKTFPAATHRLKGDALFSLKSNPLDANEMVIGNETGPLWRSTDGGLTWTDLGKPGGNARVGYNRLGQLFSSATHDAQRKNWALARWTGDKNWVQSDTGLPGDDPRSWALAPSGAIFLGNTTVYVSADDGATWKLAGAGFPAGGGRRVQVHSLVVGTDGCLYAGASSQDAGDVGIWRLQIGAPTSRPAAPAAAATPAPVSH